jgi:hypothetical protein
MCSPPEESSPPLPGQLLVSSMEALKQGNPQLARSLIAGARDGYESSGATAEEEQLIELVTARVDAAVIPGMSKAEAKRPPPPNAEERLQRAEAKAQGDATLMKAVSVFGDKSDAERFGKALDLLEESRAAFRIAGSDVEREREGVMGNLYAVIRAEAERTQRVDQLVRMKKIAELSKQKKKAETLGIDPDEISYDFGS